MLWSGDRVLVGDWVPSREEIDKSNSVSGGGKGWIENVISIGTYLCFRFVS